VVAALAAAFAVGVWLVVRRAGEVRALAERGLPVTGRVIEKRARHARGSAGRYRRIKLAYERPDAGRHERWISATPGEWESLREGEPVDLVYLGDRPAVFATLRLVNLAREAKGLPPLP
jgi:hypothetical protein